MWATIWTGADKQSSISWHHDDWGQVREGGAGAEGTEQIEADGREETEQKV